MLKKIGILYNPISGRGLSKNTAEALLKLLSDNNYKARLISSQPREKVESLRSTFSEMELMIALGGDGTLLDILPLLLDLQIPVYLMPFGNECLFSKYFGMSKDPIKVLESLRHARVESHLVARANSTLFFSMLSAGLDSQVVEHVVNNRVGPIDKRDYCRSFFSVIKRHQSPILNISVDGQTVIAKRPGFVIVSNSGQYALGMKWTPLAKSSEAGLHVAFLEYQSWLKFVTTSIAVLLLGKSSKLQNWKGNNVTIEFETPFPSQIDGDLLSENSLAITQSDQRLQVLLPPL